MSQDYNSLENQIGSLGGEAPEENTLKGKKLKYAASYGQKEKLDQSSEQSLQDFLQKDKKIRQASDDAPISRGWIPIDKSLFGKRALFYPSSYEFYIQPATVQAIKNWTAIDEERPDVVNKVFNEIIKMCVKVVDTATDTTVSWTQINSWDRFWLVLKVREYTFVEGEAKIEFEDLCSECESDITYTLTADSLFYEFPDDDLIEKYWNGKNWTIDPREYNIDHDPIELYTPKLGKDDAIIEWATQRARNKQKLDETFIKFLIWMLDKPSKDSQMLDRQIKKCQTEYKSWDIDTFSFMNDVVTNININPSEKMRCICPSCGREATSTVQFPNGVKALFAIESKAKKFGSR